MFGPGAASTIPGNAGTAVREPPTRAGTVPGRPVVFSFVGVLGITLILFFVVAGTARVILGR